MIKRAWDFIQSHSQNHNGERRTKYYDYANWGFSVVICFKVTPNRAELSLQIVHLNFYQSTSTSAGPFLVCIFQITIVQLRHPKYSRFSHSSIPLVVIFFLSVLFLICANFCAIDTSVRALACGFLCKLCQKLHPTEPFRHCNFVSIRGSGGSGPIEGQTSQSSG